ncbi:MAG: cobalt-precorrin-7 (C5)-methyltransferase [Natronomonas sp.]|jgi:cobalt-precorrin-7 (C5)-methyltransferase
MTEERETTSDPGADAAQRPEPPGEEPVAHAVGVGPGPGQLTGRARSLLSGADVVVGFESVVDLVREATDATTLTCGYKDEAAALEGFADRVASGADGVAVLMGDPNVSGYQFLGKVERAVEGAVGVVPGVSSVQVAASRARTPLERSTVLSFHRRGSVKGVLDRFARAAGRQHLLVIPRPYDWMPEDLARHAVDRGADPGLDALVFERLTQAGEKTTRSTLGTLAGDTGDGSEGTAFSDLSVLAVRAPQSQADPATATGGDE